MSVDLRNVKVGTKVRLRNGIVTSITLLNDTDVAHGSHPGFENWFCNKIDGESIGGSDPDYSIAGIIDDNNDVQKSSVAPPGIELRDVFAGCAMQGLIANIENNNLGSERISEMAYGFADAMLKARSK